MEIYVKQMIDEGELHYLCMMEPWPDDYAGDYFHQNFPKALVVPGQRKLSELVNDEITSINLGTKIKHLLDNTGWGTSAVVGMTREGLEREVKTMSRYWGEILDAAQYADLELVDELELEDDVIFNMEEDFDDYY